MSLEPYLREIDFYFANFIKELSKEKEEVFIAAALVSKATEDGHVCLDLEEIAGREQTFFVRGINKYETIRTPELNSWVNKLLDSRVVGRPGDYKPLILDQKNRLYLYRYWRYEDILIRELKRRTERLKKIEDFYLIKRTLEILFPNRDSSDLQKASSIISLITYFSVISGGPGTGKTSTIAKIIALLLKLSLGRRIFLSAPTGKASARLKQAIMEIKKGLQIEEEIKDMIPKESFTIHRMLGYVPGRMNARYNEENRLPADVVIVDEASMIDLPLMSRLVQAIPEDATLILLGDKDQLSSVEPGSVLGDICAGSKEYPEIVDRFFNGDISGLRPGIENCIIELKKNYRFSEESGIYQLSKAINSGDKERVFQILNGNYKDILFKKLPRPEILKKSLEQIVLEGYGRYLRAKDPFETLSLFESFRILTPIRWGPYGVRQINRIVESILRENLLISMESPWYAGRPILIVENSYELGLFNGDIGILMPDPESGNEIRAFFIDPEGNVRKFLPIMLPEHETAFAMTVHKSQGSEFDNVLFILPDTYVPVITRELIYTAITRARKGIEVWGRPEVIEEGITQRIRRSSGLRDALWENMS